MNILLVSPENPDTFWSLQGVVRIAGRRSAFPPLGLLTVAAMLPEHWSLELVDLNVGPLGDAAIDRADLVMISAMIVHEPSVRDVVARCHARGTPVIGGGPLFTTGSERFPELEACVIGEAEELMPQLIRDIEAGTLQPRYQAAERPDVTQTPIPRWDLIDVGDYLMLSVQCSRGCPFDCEFCDITAVYGRVPRVKTPEQMIREFEAVVGTGHDGSIFVVDDNFIGNRARAKSLLRALIDWRRERGITNRLITEASMNLVDDPELLDLMVQAGFSSIFVGIESPEEASLEECRKVQNTHRDLIETVRTIHRAGIQVMAGFIIGFDADRPDVFERQRRFIHEAGVVTAMVGLLTALPGTRLFTRLTAEGRIVGESSGDNLSTVMNFEPVLDRRLLVDGYRRLMHDLYAPRPYYRRVGQFLQDYRPARASGRRSSTELRAFARSLWVLGVASPGRLAYWGFVTRTLARHRDAFGEAMELAIRGHHFRTVARSI
jgi:radical SAM superfamily enzyme YgiQ (UPF0313 family)